jgi:hypothetical protein
MMCKIVTKLRTICNVSDPTDQKFILLAELVDDRISKVADEVLKTNQSILTLTGDLSSLAESVNKFVNFHNVCPVTKNRKQTENMLFMAKNPKLLILAIIGLSAITGVALDKALPALTTLLKLF